MDTLSDKWTRRFINAAKEAASWSRDTTKTGCVIMDIDGRPISSGFNGIPRGVKDLDERLTRPEKYEWIIHAELNAILLAGRDLRGCVLYATHFPCNHCAAAIVQSGIAHVVIDKDGQFFDDKWNRPNEIARTMFEEAGVAVHVCK